MVLELTFGLLDYDQRVGQNSTSGLPQSESRLENPNLSKKTYLPPDLKRGKTGPWSKNSPKDHGLSPMQWSA
jgi:hypothetical protein